MYERKHGVKGKINSFCNIIDCFWKDQFHLEVNNNKFTCSDLNDDRCTYLTCFGHFKVDKDEMGTEDMYRNPMQIVAALVKHNIDNKE